MAYLIGADIGGTTVKLGLFDKAKDDFIDKWEIPTDVSEEGKNILADIAEAIKAKLVEKKIDANELDGVGFGVPGPVDSKGMVHRCVNLGWGYINLEEEFKKLMNVKAVAGNDASVAALGEYWKGGGKEYENVVFITLGTGVGGGIICDGKLVLGSVGAAGEIGHFVINRDETEACGCGNRGCLEQYASATGIVRQAKSVLAGDHKHSMLDEVSEVTSKEIFDSAKKGDEVAMEIVDWYADKLAFGVTCVCCVTDPDVIIIGGGVAKAGDMLIDKTKQAFLENAFHAHRHTEFKLATLGNDAGIYGAVKSVY